MKSIYTIIFIFLLSGCGQSFNSNSGDASQYEPISGIDDSTPEGERFLAAYKVYKNNCFTCHAWEEYKTSAHWVASSLVVPNSISTSKVYTDLRNVGGDMPPSQYPQLTTEEVATIVAWINGM